MKSLVTTLSIVALVSSQAWADSQAIQKQADQITSEERARYHGTVQSRKSVPKTPEEEQLLQQLQRFNISNEASDIEIKKYVVTGVIDKAKGLYSYYLLGSALVNFTGQKLEKEEKVKLMSVAQLNCGGQMFEGKILKRNPLEFKRKDSKLSDFAFVSDRACSDTKKVLDEASYDFNILLTTANGQIEEAGISYLNPNLSESPKLRGIREQQKNIEGALAEIQYNLSDAPQESEPSNASIAQDIHDQRLMLKRERKLPGDYPSDENVQSCFDEIRAGNQKRLEEFFAGQGQNSSAEQLDRFNPEDFGDARNPSCLRFKKFLMPLATPRQSFTVEWSEDIWNDSHVDVSRRHYSKRLKELEQETTAIMEKDALAEIKAMSEAEAVRQVSRFFRVQGLLDKVRGVDLLTQSISQLATQERETVDLLIVGASVSEVAKKLESSGEDFKRSLFEVQAKTVYISNKIIQEQLKKKE